MLQFLPDRPGWRLHPARVLLACGGALLAGAAGFALATALSVPRPEPLPDAVVPHSPEPPVVVPSGGLAAAPAAPAAPAQQPRITLRSYEPAPAVAEMPPAAPLPRPQLAVAAPSRPEALRPPPPPWTGAPVRVVPAPPAPTPDVEPDAEQGMVYLRNRSGRSLTVSIEGDGAETVTVGAGAVMPVPLPPGSYQLHIGDSDISGKARLQLRSGVRRLLDLEEVEETTGRRLQVLEVDEG